MQRRFSSSTTGPSTSTAPSQSAAAPLTSITNELDKLSPRFDISADSIEILRDPAQFYSILKVGTTFLDVATPVDRIPVG